MRKARFIILIVTISAIVSCNKDDKKTKLAQVHDKFLYLEDVADIFPDDVNDEDSITIIKNKIDLWVRKQAMLKRAELNLTEEQKDIEEIVNDYRSSLLIEKYKQEYLKQNIDTVIKENEIKNYYNDYLESFKINEEIVKASFYKFNISDKNVQTFRKYFTDEDEESLLTIKEIAEESAVKTEDFSHQWIEISVISNLLPNDIKQAENFLRVSKYMETRDKDFYYFVYFKDYLLKGETLPYELAKDRIKIILINKRKTNLLNELEKKIYQNDIKNGNIKVFVD